MRCRLTVFAFLVCIASCAGSPASAIPGFVLTRQTTKCHLGTGVKYSTGRWDQWTGADGLFKIDPHNQLAICEANWPSGVQGPSASVETAEVQAYFTGAGMPPDQAGAVTLSYGSDSTGTSFPMAKFERVVQGYSVVESMAWAGLLDGHSLGESVYWPALPASVCEELSELESMVGDSGKLTQFRAKLPSAILGGTIAIHHTTEYSADAFKAHACYDALVDEGGFGVTKCFLPDGSEWTGSVYPPPMP